MNGVLYETGSGKYLKLISGNAEFHSSWEDATQITFEKYQNEKHFLLDHHNIDWYFETIFWVPIFRDAGGFLFADRKVMKK